MTYMYIAWAKTKRTLKFVWRHLFTLGILGIHISVVIETSLNWKNAFLLTVTCIVLDWVKRFIKFTPNHKTHYYSHIDSHATSRSTLNDQWWNPSVMGTPAYLMRNGNYN